MNKLRLFLLITLSILFGLLVFTFNTSVYLTFGLALLILGITAFLVKENIKRIDPASLFIFLIPVAALGLFYAIGMFSNEYYSIGERIMIPFVMIIFTLIGSLFRCFQKDELKYIFYGLFGGLAVITIINFALTMYHYGPFYGRFYGTYFLYYNGAESRETMSGIAYALCGFSVKNVPIEYYLIFPALLTTLTPHLLLGNYKTRIPMIAGTTLSPLIVLSMLLIGSKISILVAVISSIVTVFTGILHFPDKIKFKKALKIGGIVFFSLLVVLFIFTVLNAQSNNTVFKNITTSNKFLNYVFNTNKYIEKINVVLNGIFSKDKLIGFPIVFDEGYALLSYPSSNILVNQFMYGGVFGFIFFVLLFVVFFFNFKNTKRKIGTNDIRMLPFYFTFAFFALSLFIDPSLTDEFNVTHFIFTPLNPFFLITLLAGSFYTTSLRREVKVNEK